MLWVAVRDGVLLVTAGAVAGLLLATFAVRPLVDLVIDGVEPWDLRLFAEKRRVRWRDRRSGSFLGSAFALVPVAVSPLVSLNGNMLEGEGIDDHLAIVGPDAVIDEIARVDFAS